MVAAIVSAKGMPYWLLWQRLLSFKFWKEWRSFADQSQSFAYLYNFKLQGMEKHCTSITKLRLALQF
jgi:hypothetical protein